MRIKVFILALLTTFCFSFTVSAQRVTVDFKDAKLEKVLDEMSRQTGCFFNYSRPYVNPEEKVSISVKDVEVGKALEILFKDKNIAVKADGNKYYLVEKSRAEQDAKKSDKTESIRGVVVDRNGEPVSGAFVVVSSSGAGTLADLDGRFEIQASRSDVLKLSSLGFSDKEYPLKGTSGDLEIVLDEDNEFLDEVVVVGYGSARKGNLTGPISTVKGEAISGRSTGNIATALQGQISGVQVTRSSGSPGADATIRVRGITTMSDNDPLVIIDGVPSSMSTVSSDDIESLTVLKDASAAAIYGSRAAAGVILITTKNAEEGKFSVDYSYEYSIDTPTARAKVGTVLDYLNVMNEFKWNDGASEQYNQYSKDFIDSYMDYNEIDPYHYPNTDWQDLLLKNITSHQRHTFSITGGTKVIKTKFNANYFDQDGWYKCNNKNFNRFTSRLNTTIDITPWAKATLNVDFSKSHTKSPAFTNVITAAYRAPATYNAYWENGDYADVKDGSNYLAALKEGGKSLTDLYRLGGKLQLDITPVKGLTLTAALAPRYNFTYKKQFNKQVKTYYEDGSMVYQQSFMNTSLEEERNNSSSMTYQFFANYQHTFGNHDFSLMAGYEGYYYKWESLGASRTNFVLDTYPYLDLGPEDYQYNSGAAGHNGYQSGFARAMYSYKNKYLFQVNFRADASSRFAKHNRTGYYPSLSAGWAISNEPWFKNNVVDFMKLRASWGQLGNERIGSEFPYLALMSFGTTSLFDKNQQVAVPITNAAQYVYAFDDISWETTSTFDVGVDMNFFGGRLGWTADYYYKKTTDMLLVLGFPLYSGYSAPEQNAGDMYTHGWETQIKWNDSVGDFSYGLSFNISDYRSRMGYMGDKMTLNSNGSKIIEQGSYFNEWYLYRSRGLFQTEADFYDEYGRIPTLTQNDQPGCIRYIDWNGDGILNSDDKVRSGNSLPEYIFGGDINMAWRGIDFNVQFQGVGHQNVLFNTAWIQAPQGQWGNVPELVLGNYWSRANTPEQNLKAKYPLLTYQNRTNTEAPSDYWLFNGAYFRFKNITLGYTLPTKWTKKFFVQKLRLYVSGQDLPAFSRYPKGWDPEVTSLGNDFIATSIIFGANIKF